MADTADDTATLKATWAQLAVEVGKGVKIDHAARNKAKGPRDVETAAVAGRAAHAHMKNILLHKIATRPIPACDDALVLSYERFTDGLPMKDYERCIQSVPELVNLVSLADAVPNAGSVTLPFNLTEIAKRCRNASLFFAPKSFTAIQFAFTPPRSRVLLFHTGRLVGTGSNTPAAAKLSILRAVRQIQTEAGISIAIRRFSVINLVGAGTLGARLDLTAFSAQHRDSANFDRKLFVGLPWRAPNEACCAEIYSTGKMNLPGARRERDLINSYARMACEMLRLSDNPKLRDLFPKYLHDAHRPIERAKTATEKAHAIDAMWDDKDDSDLTMMETLARARQKVEGISMNSTTGKKRQQVEQSGFTMLGKNKRGGATAAAVASSAANTSCANDEDNADGDVEGEDDDAGAFRMDEIDDFAIGGEGAVDVFEGVF